MDIISGIEPSMIKQLDKIIIHANMNGTPDNVSYLANAQMIVKIVCETSSNSKFCFSSIISRIDFKDINGKIKKISRHFKK